MSETPLDKAITEKLETKGYQFIPKLKFKASLYLKQPFYTTHFHIGDGIYETPKSCDYILFHPEKWPDCLIIESLWQQSTGTTDEKFPYVVLNVQQRYPHRTVIVIDGGGYRQQALQWLKSQEGNNIVKVFSLGEFSKWVDKGNI